MLQGTLRHAPVASRAGTQPWAAPARPALMSGRGRCTCVRPLAAAADSTVDTQKLFTQLGQACTAFKKAPPSMKLEFSADVLSDMKELQAAGALPKWGSEAASNTLSRRNVFMGELKQMGIKSPDKLAVPSIRNDAAFLITTVGTVSVAAVILGQLPGDWGFFTSYLTGGIALGVLAVGSTAPGLLQVVIDKFSQVFPDYKQRVIQHEAAHFLVGYLMGVPVCSYSLGIGQEHVEFAETKLQARIITKTLEDSEVDALAAVAVAGIAAEGLFYEEVMGQTADLLDLQRILLRSQSKMSDAQQQNMTRWAVWTSARLLKQYKAEYEALQEALARGAGVDECIQIIEKTPSAT